MVIFNVAVKENHHEFASNLAQLIESDKVGNHYELVKDDILFEALTKRGFTISQEDSMMIMDITDYTADFTLDDMITIYVVQTSDELKHWGEINRAYFGDLYYDKEWDEIHATKNVVIYLAKYNGTPASSIVSSGLPKAPSTQQYLQ